MVPGRRPHDRRPRAVSLTSGPEQVGHLEEGQAHVVVRIVEELPVATVIERGLGLVGVDPDVERGPRVDQVGQQEVGVQVVARSGPGQEPVSRRAVVLKDGTQREAQVELPVEAQAGDLIGQDVGSAGPVVEVGVQVTSTELDLTSQAQRQIGFDGLLVGRRGQTRKESGT